MDENKNHLPAAVEPMKKLYLMRHAKSSWDNPNLSDFDRPLNDRGRTDAPRMGKRLKEVNVIIDLMLSSPAARAIATCREVAAAIGYPSEKIKIDKRIYHADPDQLLSILKTLNEVNEVESIIIFGHNPGLTDFANDLFNGNIENIPTCGVVACALNIALWSEITRGCGKLLFFDFPKK